MQSKNIINSIINQLELHVLEVHAKYKAPNMMRTGSSQDEPHPKDGPHPQDVPNEELL